MKSYKEMAADVFRRRDEFVRKRQRRNQILLRTGAVSGFCVLLLSAGILVPAMTGREAPDYDLSTTGTTGSYSDSLQSNHIAENEPSDTQPAPNPVPDENHDDEPSVPATMPSDESLPPDDPYIVINVIPEYTAPGRRLVERVTVSAEEFAQTFPLDISGFPSGTEYAFEYRIDPDTLEIDKSALENGVVTVRDANTGESCHFCISGHGAIYDSCILPGSEAKASVILGKDVLLFQLFGEKEIIFSELELNDLYITATFPDYDQENVVNMLTKLIESNLIE